MENNNGKYKVTTEHRLTKLETKMKLVMASNGLIFAGVVTLVFNTFN